MVFVLDSFHITFLLRCYCVVKTRDKIFFVDDVCGVADVAIDAAAPGDDALCVIECRHLNPVRLDKYGEVIDSAIRIATISVVDSEGTACGEDLHLMRFLRVLLLCAGVLLLL